MKGTYMRVLDRAVVNELVLINTFTGEEHNINNYNDDLTHCKDSQLDIVGFDG